ncbi:sulfonate transporter [Candidatus Gottesmanbacteria bacterium RIFCSPHIGHO2_02_FULL_39_11]|uniref:Probable membrane transporter protein n=1 Tax=Candidatus Gottesmanbacteria bacterium RIFCSPHIGHO2_02_FULL_39_11 TaxID=1798382 RepID=A0A1F5ZNJ1_9BACT|nr:MAG: sulfonate transporter [Candidatus Gottesmanbacteria bacterium RIFCSPHIGHO2_02_FULL_39_11]
MVSILFFLFAFISEIIGTIAGFGSSTVFLPLALLFFDFKTALVLVALFHIFGNISRISFFKHGLDKHMLFIFGIPSVVLTLMGALLITYLPQEMLKGILGVFLIIYSIISLWKEDLKVRPSLFNSVIGGGLSGFLAGLIGTGGALRGAFLTAFGLPKEKYITTAAAIALAVDFTRIPVYFAEGFLTSQYYWYIPVLLSVALIGSFTGKQIVKQLPQKTFRKVVLSAILIIGLMFVYDLLA